MGCKQCNQELTNPRAKFCSDRCRMAWKRSQPEQIDPNKQPEQSDPNTGSLGPVESRSQATGEVGEPNSGELPTNRGNGPYPGGTACECKMCQNYRAKGKSLAMLNHGPHLTANELAKISPLARNRVPLPGDSDYKGVA